MPDTAAAEFRGMVSAKLQTICRSLEELAATIKDHETRVRELEKRLYIAVGVVLAFSALSWLPMVLRMLGGGD